MHKKISTRFKLVDATRSDTANRLGINNNVNKEQFANICGVATHILEPLCEQYGVVFWISSWYRCPELNQALGGAKQSVHMTGSAVDLYPREELTAFDLAHKIRQTAKDYNKLILEYGQRKDGSWRAWCHVEFNDENLHRKDDITMIKPYGEPAQYNQGIIGWCPPERS